MGFHAFGKPRIAHKLQQEKACVQDLFMQVKDWTGKEKSKPHTRGLHHRIATHNPCTFFFAVQKDYKVSHSDCSSHMRLPSKLSRVTLT